MLRSRSILFDFIVVVFIFILFFVPSKTKGQAWSDLLAPNRAVNWSGAGAGTIPSRTTICQALGAAGQASTYPQSVTAANIASALQACAGTNETVYLNPGTYTMTATVFGPYGSAAGTTPSNVTLRGAGPQQTILKWTGTSNNCNGINATAFCMYNGDSGTEIYSQNIMEATSGVTQGSTSVTLGAAYPGQCCDGGSSVSHLHIGSLMGINQCDTGFTGYPCSGNALGADNGNWFNCGAPPPGGGLSACTWGGNSNSFTNATQGQIVTVTGIVGSTVTFTPALYAPNWTSSQAPMVWFSSLPSVTGFGLENLQVNTQSIGDIQAMVESIWTTNSWVKNVALINAEANYAAARKHVSLSASAHMTVRDSYMYGGQPGSDDYGVDFLWNTSDSLAENNICQHLSSCTMLESGVGNVFGYNYAVDNFYTGFGGAPQWQQCDAYHHNAGDYYDLWEGHEGICAALDDGHGTSFGLTYFRSYFNGRDKATTCPAINPGCGTQSKIQATDAFGISWGSRYENIVMDVLGDGVYANIYQNVGTQGNPNSCPAQPETVLYSLNFANGNQIPFSPACTGTGYTLDNDALVSATLTRWGNYDTVTGTVRTNSGETSSGAAVYPGLASPSTSYASYPSLYLSGTPAWWTFPDGDAATPWPAVGPDISGGNISNVGGHAYHNPAANCYLDVLGGQTNGSSGPLPFDASVCYPTSASKASGPLAPYNLAGTVVQ